MPNIGMFPILCGLGIRAVAVPASLCLLLGSPGKNGFRMRLGVSQSDAFLLHNLAEGGEIFGDPGNLCTRPSLCPEQRCAPHSRQFLARPQP